MRYCHRNRSEDVHPVDVAHNIGEVVQVTSGALRTLKDNLEKPVEEIFALHALTPQVPRMRAGDWRDAGTYGCPD